MRHNANRGFTLIELLVTLGIGGIIFSIILTAIDPGRRFAEARNGQRWGGVKNIHDALYQYQIDNRGIAIPGVDTQMRQIGTAASGCSIPCFYGEEAGVVNSFVDDTQTEFDAGTHANTQWSTGALLLSSAPSGTYTSRIFNAGAQAAWATLSWMPAAPYGKPLPNNAQQEAGYATANANMSGNGALWHLNETAGQVQDSSGNSKHSIVQSALSYGAPGVFGGAIRFNGTNSYADFPTIFPYSPPSADINELTVELWMRATVNPSGVGVMAWQGRGGTYVVQVNALGEISFVVKQTKYSCENYDGNWLGVNSAGSNYTNGQWHHIVGRYHRGENTAQLYVDGDLKGTVTLNPNECLSDTPTSHPPILGASSHYSGSRLNFYTGDIDEVALYSRALSAGEIQERYERGARNMRTQVRACNNPACSDGIFVGPSGTAVDYYDEEDNAALTPPALSIANLSSGRYFQYQTTFSGIVGAQMPAAANITVTNNATGSATLSDTCIDLSQTLSRYLPRLPTDPSAGSNERTGYAVGLTQGNVFIVRSCSAERSEVIERR